MLLPIAVAAYLLLNALVAGMFVSDKRRAVRRGYRIPEKRLLVASALGPFGAVVAMNKARHKTRKARFLLVHLFMTLHGSVIIWLFLDQ